MGKRLTGVELFAAGVWNGIPVTDKLLNAIAKAYNRFADVISIPLKFGHNDEQPMTDGQPRIGTVHNVRVEGGKLVGDMQDVPNLVYSALANKLYNSLSIELDLDVSYKGEEFPFVLTGVGLLGADLPAVNTLKDLEHYIDDKESKGFSAKRKVVYSYEPNTKPEDDFMTKEEIEKLQAENATLKAQFSAQQNSNTEMATKLATLEQDNATFKAKLEANEKAQAAVAFSTAKTEVTDKLEALVKAEKLTPAQRDLFTAQIKDGDLDSVVAVKATADTLADGVDLAAFSKEAQKVQSKEKDQNASEMPADEAMLIQINKIRGSQGVDFSTAKDIAFKADPQLARDYIELTEEV